MRCVDDVACWWWWWRLYPSSWIREFGSMVAESTYAARQRRDELVICILVQEEWESWSGTQSTIRGVRAIPGQ